MSRIPPVRHRHPVQGGYTHAERWRVELDDGRRAFLKRATDDDTAGWIRAERRVYESLAGAPFLAQVLAYEEGERPALLLEDLGSEGWPPPWPAGGVERVLETLAAIHDTPPPADLVQITNKQVSGWWSVAENPEPLLSLGWFTPAWLDQALGPLMASEAALPFDEAVLCHLDTRSDNVCLLPDRVVVVDWNWAALGPRGFDAAFWSPSLHCEGGPPPERISPPGEGWASCVSGFFARVAPGRPMPLAPRVRPIQKAQLTAALPWAVRVLGLPPLDGHRWPGEAQSIETFLP